MKETAFRFPARDGFSLAANLFEPSGADNGRAIIINAATGVPRQYYNHFARFLSEQGFSVLTYDYRGINESLPTSMRKFKEAQFTDWGRHDLPGAIDFMTKAKPGHRIGIIGHSGGGQMLGLADNIGKVKAAHFIASQHGNWRLWPAKIRLPMFMVMYGIIPGLTAVAGYFPGQLVGMSALPAGVAKSWARMCRSREYLIDEDGRYSNPHGDKITIPIRSWCFTDDIMAPSPAVKEMKQHYPNADFEWKPWSPRDWGMKSIGHFGFFRRSMPQNAWTQVADWMKEKTA